MDFTKKYPIDLIEAIATPMIVRESVKDEVRLPRVTLAGLRQLAEYAGFSYGALRTALTRLKQKGVVRAFDEDGVTRFELCDFYYHVTRHYTNTREEDGFTLAVISSASASPSPSPSPGRDRHRLQEALDAFGFRKLSPGVYISGRLDTSGLLAELEKYALAGSLYLFDCDPVQDLGMLERIKGLWDLEGWLRRAEEFLHELQLLYQPESLEGLEDQELYNRIFYVGPAFYRYLQRDFPRLHHSHFPGRLIHNQIDHLMEETLRRHSERVFRHFATINT